MPSYPQTRVSIGSANRNRTPDCWRGALEAYLNDPTLGKLCSTDFTKARVQVVDSFLDGLWVAEDDVAGATAEAFNTAVTPAANAGDGVATLAGTTGTDNQAVKAQAAAGATTLPEYIRLPSDIVDPRGDVIFEASAYIDNAAADQFFLGLAVNAAAVLASGVIEGAQSVIGFLRTDAGALKFVARNDNAGGTAVSYSVDVALATAFTTAGWHNFAFRVNKDQTVEVFVDDVKIVRDVTTPTTKVAVTQTSLPEVGVVRTAVVGRGATANNATVALPLRRFEVFQGE